MRNWAAVRRQSIATADAAVPCLTWLRIDSISVNCCCDALVCIIVVVVRLLTALFLVSHNAEVPRKLAMIHRQLAQSSPRSSSSS